MFLLSDWSEAISGEVIHVDGGAHAVGAVSGLRVQGALGSLDDQLAGALDR